MQILDEIKTNLNKNNKLDCKMAFELVKKFNISLQDFEKIIEENKIRIDNCELGCFGKFDKAKIRIEILEDIEKLLDEKRRISCKEALKIASKYDIKDFRTTLKEYKIDIKHCELGCFDEKKGKKFSVKSKIWIENPEGHLLFGKGKTDILELVGESGSISKAAKILGLNYKKAWLYIQDLQENMKEELIIAKQGRGVDSGTRLTSRAYELIEKYKILQEEVEEFTNKRFKELFFGKKE